MASVGIFGLAADELKLDDHSSAADLYRIELGPVAYIEVGIGDRQAEADAMDRLAELAAEVARRLRGGPDAASTTALEGE